MFHPRNLILPAAILILLLAGCVPAAPTPAPTLPSMTAAVSTALPGGTATLPTVGSPGATPVFPTPLPTLPGNASPTELKYKLLRQFPNLFFCDPDYYPVARADETELARQIFPQLQTAADEFQAILNHTGLQGQTSFSDGQKLLIYREHKKLAAIRFVLSQNQYRFQLQISDSSQQGFVVTGWINGDGQITVEQRQPSIATCPICLAAHTRIDTPRGPVPVEDLRPGDPVWTTSADGARIAATILKTVRVLVPSGHLMAHVVISDGRELWASPGHPLAGGGTLGGLHPGDRVDGAPLARLELAPYNQPATYDLLPSGETGFYWANGILIGSTLTKK